MIFSRAILARRTIAVAALASATLLLSGCSTPAIVAHACVPRDKSGQPTVNFGHGRSIFVQQCAVCHTLADANARGATGPDLDQLQPTAQDTCRAIDDGAGSMPAGLVKGTDRSDVAGYVARATRDDDVTGPPANDD